MERLISLYGLTAIILLSAISCLLQPNSTPMLLVAGNGEAGFADGLQAKMHKPIRLAPYTDSTVLVADIYNHAIREVTLEGKVTTLVGGPEHKGYHDGLASEAKIESPHGVAYDAHNNIIYFAEASTHVVRMMIKNQHGEFVVSTLAGTPGNGGFQDGPADSAMFSSPHGILICSDGGLAVADIGNARIRKIKDGVVSTLAGSTESGNQDGIGTEASFQYVMDMVSQGDYIYAADAGSHLIRKIGPDNRVTTLQLKDTLDTPHGIAIDADENIYIADMGTHRILKIDPLGEIAVIAGTGNKGGKLNELNKPAAVLVHNNNLWIADLDNHQIKILTL